jgi:hypothetical protein
MFLCVTHRHTHFVLESEAHSFDIGDTSAHI